MDEQREFDNPFPDYSPSIPAASLTAPDGRRVRFVFFDILRFCVFGSSLFECAFVLELRVETASAEIL